MEERTYPPKEYDCETVMLFGKHKGKTCKQIYEEGEEGAGYLNWMVVKFTNDTFTDRFHSMIRGEEVIEDNVEEDIPF